MLLSTHRCEDVLFKMFQRIHIFLSAPRVHVYVRNCVDVFLGVHMMSECKCPHIKCKVCVCVRVSK